ncbi:hypothetical protein, partial [Limosilactobacillus fermentum]|uniref:hypothetical protein n=1 Tax=Limosilactobacillus fermentum TaxID=1613 RepID=UPI00352A788F
MNTAKRSDLTQPQRTIMVVVLMTGSFCTVLNQNLLATAYPILMRHFAVNTSTVQWLTTGFLMVNGVMIPVSAYLINISRKSRDFSHGMDRPLLSPFMGLFVCFCIFLV